ncbi:hypothetical protein MRB53_031949 [Persea americana]|uniref:Uncharacterized protein n=1 Tax=Persea americana TaxID=3435 RepID=A0ACC2KR21_PERAE|nr:hypothetical protein MRB53_031949 [Persea americana]|eukprot:TRINITY_DN104652_c0_g1_i1.p1 TRINITY_DN104652_c0_g1~~TRINITY_DN104652_c0_g1_i1.p1  ORF type:complete len:152 (+),score=39.68 TRINITY_DN104652_c0_g1_i1:276-731(+)
MCPSGRSEVAGSLKIRPAFQVLDTDRDGKISLDDLRTFYAGFNGAGATEEDMGSMISVADSNRNGFVEFDEFEQVLGCTIKSGGGFMEDVFRVMDRDGDGKVGFDDLKSYMSWAGLYSSDDDIWAMIRLGGGDGKGVGYDGMLKILSVELS